MAAVGRASGAASWEELLSRAKRLESQLDAELSAFASLASAVAATTVNQRDLERGVPTMSDEARTRATELQTSISGLLSSLGETNEAMSGLASGPTASISQLHTVHRHREILTEYASEFRKVALNVAHYRETADLLSSVRSEISAYKSSAQGAVLRESTAVANTDTLTDALLGRAAAAREALDEDSRMFARVDDRLEQLVARYPLINSLLGRVSAKKRRNMLILAVAIALGTIFCLWYWLNK